MKKIYFITFCMLLHLSVKAQFTPVTSQYMFNGLVINPAYAGAMDAFVASASHRSQWTGLEGAPRTENFSLHGPLANKKIALGLMFFRDQIGVTTQNGLYAQYAYRLHLGKSNLAFGVGIGASFFKSSWNQLSTVVQNDPTFTQASTNYILPNASFGIYFHNRNFFAGISLPFFLSPKQISGSGWQQVTNDFNHYNFHAQVGGYLHFSKNFVLKPSVLVKSKLEAYPQADLNLMTLLYNRFGFGISYRTDDAWVFPLQYFVNDQLLVAYSYDMGFSALSNYHNGSHEVLIRYIFLYKKNVISTRSF